MKNLKNIAIIVLIILALLQFFNPGGVLPGGKTIRIEGKKYEVIKHDIDTIDIVKTKIVTKKGEDIYHETILHDTAIKLVNVDTMALLHDYFAKNIYKDTLHLPDSLGIVSLIDTITQNKILGRTFNASVKQRTIKETTIVKELPKTKVFYGLEGGFNKVDVVSHLGFGVLINTKQDKIFHLGIGAANRVTDGVTGTSGTLAPYIGAGVYWKIKVKK
jgi:hypothetical protein